MGQFSNSFPKHFSYLCEYAFRFDLSCSFCEYPFIFHCLHCSPSCFDPDSLLLAHHWLGLSWIYCISSNKSFSSPRTSSRKPYTRSKQQERQKHSVETTINFSGSTTASPASPRPHPIACTRGTGPAMYQNGRTPQEEGVYIRWIKPPPPSRTALQCSKAKHWAECGDDHAPVTRGRMRAKYPLPHGPPDQSDHRGQKQIYKGGNLVGPFLVHKLLGPRPPSPPPPLRVVAMTICLCHGGICECNIRCSWPPLPPF